MAKHRSTAVRGREKRIGSGGLGKALPKCPTGIAGLDEITGGGLPLGRPTLVCGRAGCGKTLLAMEFLVRGARDFGDPGVYMSFEETEAELAANVASLGFDIPGLVRRKKLALDYVRVARNETEETGEYDLEGLFVRLGSAIDAIGAKRVVLDTIESLFASLPNDGILRAELRRLFSWLKNKGMTAVITGEQAHVDQLTRQGLEEFVSDCVIHLDHRVVNQVATRRLRIIKYRGTSHGTNEYPAMIDEGGLSILPITVLELSVRATRERVTSGVAPLDAMLGGGYWRGSSVLMTGTAGTGKTSFAVAFADSVCRRGGRCLYLSFEESPSQVARNMASIGFQLTRHIRSGRLLFNSVRPTSYGLESHLVNIHALVKRFRPETVIMDPITGLGGMGNTDEIKAMLTRIIDYFKNERITAVFTSLTDAGSSFERSEVGISTLMDTWIILQMVEAANERRRILSILKSRGMAHSHQTREFRFNSRGIHLLDFNGGPAPSGEASRRSERRS